jgi:hypothetical protein
MVSLILGNPIAPNIINHATQQHTYFTGVFDMPKDKSGSGYHSKGYNPKASKIKTGSFEGGPKPQTNHTGSDAQKIKVAYLGK